MFPPATLTEMAQRSALSVCVDGEPCGGMGAVGGRPGVNGKTVERVCRTLGSGCQGDARRRPVIYQSFLRPQSTHRSSPAVTASVAHISLAPRQSVVLFLTQSKKKMILKQKKEVLGLESEHGNSSCLRFRVLRLPGPCRWLPAVFVPRGRSRASPLRRPDRPVRLPRRLHRRPAL